MRERWRLHQGWYFIDEDAAECPEEKAPGLCPSNWQEVTVPHTFRLEPYAKRGVTTAQGIGTYVRYFEFPEEMKYKNLYMTFDAVTGVTDVWLNGVLLHTNYGGYLPFVVYLNDAAYFDGRDNVLVVRTNNEDNGQVPPGKPQDLLDFTYFGGMYRDVWLDVAEDIFITDPLYEKAEGEGGIILEYPKVSEEEAEISAKVQVRSAKNTEEQITVLCEVLDREETVVEKDEQSISLAANSVWDVLAEFKIDKPSLWNLSAPVLYTFRVTISVGGTVTEQKTTRFGIREIEVDRERGLLINGEVQPFLSGVNRHQDYPLIGNAAPASMQRRDAILIKEAGFKVVRAAHYPMSEAFLDACDELGLLVFEATPGWQWYPTDQPEPFSARVRENIRQMVQRDRNHPCVLAYETVLNETYHVPYGFSRKSALTALAEQKSAKIAAESYGYDARPEANGIDREADFIYGFQDPLEKTEKAVMFLRECTDCYIEYYGDFHSRRVTRGTTDGFYPHGEARNLVKANQMLFRNLPEEYSLARCYQIRSENPAFVGAAIWTGIDSRGAGSLMSPCGIWDGYRLPKTAYWAYKSQQEGRTIIYIASEWTKHAPSLDKSDKPVTIGSDAYREIYVYSNVAKVVLAVERQGKVLWEKEEVPYKEENAAYLPHPPFYFASVPYETGTLLRARGYDFEGNLLAEDVRKTAGEPHHLRVSVDTLGVPVHADGNDLVLVRAEILDEQGVLCTGAEQKIFFTIEGDARIVGDGNLLAGTNPAWAEAGIASAYIRSGHTSGKITVCASGKGLLKGKTELELEPSERDGIDGSVCTGTDTLCKGRFNLLSHERTGDARALSKAEADGEQYPESILLKGTAVWKLRGETYFQTGYKVLSGDREAELFFYLDDVLRYRGKAADIKLCVEGAKEMRIEFRAEVPTEIVLLSPYLWEEKLAEKETELSENIAFGKTATASVNPECAQDVWNDGIWFGKNPREGLQEWQVDLGGVHHVRNAKVFVGGQMGSDCTFYEYEIHTSLDGVHWEKQAENRRTSWSNGVSDYFTAQDVRYVKVRFLQVDGRLCAGIQQFEIYEDFGVDSVNEYALSGIVVQDNDLIFEPESLEYRLPKQEELKIQALAFDEKAEVRVDGKTAGHPEDHRISSVMPITVRRETCDGTAEIQVQSASGKGVRVYRIYF